jgi:hypothetical protein
VCVCFIPSGHYNKWWSSVWATNQLRGGPVVTGGHLGYAEIVNSVVLFCYFWLFLIPYLESWCRAVRRIAAHAQQAKWTRRRFRSLPFRNAGGDFTDEKHVLDTRTAGANVIHALSSHKIHWFETHRHLIHTLSSNICAPQSPAPATNFTSSSPFLFSPAVNIVSREKTDKVSILFQ